jgi:hypothetical protein
MRSRHKQEEWSERFVYVTQVCPCPNNVYCVSLLIPHSSLSLYIDIYAIKVKVVYTLCALLQLTYVRNDSHPSALLERVE